MNLLNAIFLKQVFHFVFMFLVIINITEAQVCEGSWTRTELFSYDCIIQGNFIGNLNISDNPTGCPLNPLYTPNQTNTFTFSNPVSDFTIDFNSFSGPDCARIEVKINNLFYHLTNTNFVDYPAGSGCTGVFTYMEVTPDGYLTGIPGLSINKNGGGRIIITGVNATSVTFSTNDGAGSIFTTPFNCISVIPIKLESFTGLETTDCRAILNWKTGIESNVSTIEVLRSADRTEFKKIAAVLPKGSDSYYTVETSNYTDAFFKLKIIDLDGQYKYSKTLNVKSKCNEIAYQINPNPAHNFVEITKLRKDDNLLVLDILGRTMLTFKVSQTNQFDIHKLSSGMYFLQLTNANGVKVNIKFVKN